MKQLAKAIIAVMNEVTNIEKSMNVGQGTASYKGVSDKDVKHIVGNAMAKNGLCLVPIEVDAKTHIDRWEETYQNQVKTKQSVFTEVTTKYMLLHESGESIVLSGYGQGVDSQDKSAGKATTYALKNTILYTFLIPTGEIDDTDKTHSDTMDVPKGIPVTVKEPDIKDKVASLQNKKPSLTISELEIIQTQANSQPTIANLESYWNSLTKDTQGDQGVINIFKRKKEQLKS